MPAPGAEGLTDFIYEMGLLKRYRRAGWLVAGVGGEATLRGDAPARPDG